MMFGGSREKVDEGERSRLVVALVEDEQPRSLRVQFARLRLMLG